MLKMNDVACYIIWVQNGQALYLIVGHFRFDVDDKFLLRLSSGVHGHANDLRARDHDLSDWYRGEFFVQGQQIFGVFDAASKFAVE